MMTKNVGRRHRRWMQMKFGLEFLVELERKDILRAGDSVYRFVFLVERSSKVFYPYLSTLFSFVAVAVYSNHMD